VPEELLRKAHDSTGGGITQTIRRGPELAAAGLAVTDGYWQRAAALRARGLAARSRARLGDALIAQSCLDHDVRLITRDRDFQIFARAAAR
jgi:predicted nucleic acid-binding protein